MCALNDALPSGYESVPELKAVLQSFSLSVKSGFEHADTPQRAHLSPTHSTLQHTSASALLRFLSSDHASSTQQTTTAVKGLVVDTVGSQQMAAQ